MNCRFRRSHYLNSPETKPIFGSFSNREMAKSYSNSMYQKMKDQKKEIQKLFKINFGLFQAKKKKSVIYFIHHMAHYLFGPHGVVSRKLKWVGDIFKVSKFNLDTKIQIGKLYYFEIKDNKKSSYANHLTETKKGYLRRSVHFNYDDNFKSDSIYNSFLTHAKGIKKNNLSKNTYLTNLSNNFSRSSLLSPHTRNNKSQCMELNNSKRFSTDYSRNGKAKKIIMEHTTESHIPKIKKIIFKRPKTSLHSRETNEQLARRRLNKTTYLINSMCIGIQIENDSNKKKITKVFSRGNSPPSLKMNNFLCNTWAPKQKYMQPIASQLESEKRKDLEIALDMKIGENPNENYLKVIKKMQEIDNSEYIKRIIHLSEGITKVNEETALKFEKQIKDDYNKKTNKKKLYISDFTPEIRKKLNMNYNKIETILCKFDKVKRKIFASN